MFGSGDVGIFLSFCFVSLLLAISTLPLSACLFRKFKDKGFIYSKVIGLFFSGYLMWLLSSLHILAFTLINCIICVVLVTVAVYLPVLLIEKCRQNFTDALKNSYLQMILSEVIFIAVFAFLTWLFAHRIQGHDTERVMDFAFMMTLSKTEYMPPVDVWAAGDALNYYYFGQYIITYITKLSCLSMDYGYTLGLFFIAAFGFTGVFRLVESLAKSFVAGLMSAIAVIFAGNMHYFVFYKLVPAAWDILRLSGEKPTYWFANSTRYIGYVPDTNDKTIHEFPAYSFIVGDLHAHVINILIVVTILALLWAYLDKGYELKIHEEASDLINEGISPYFLLIGMFLSISSMSNYWDFPIYYVVSGSIILFSFILRHRLSKKTFGYTALAGATIMLLILLLALPFNSKFVKMVNGIGISQNHTYIHQLLILWGFPIIMLFVYMVYILFVKQKDFAESDLYIISVGLCATGLVFVPEIVFIKDIYINGYARANTMFKLTYQSFIMFGIILGYIIWNLIRSKNFKFKKYGIAGAVGLFIVSMYFVTACRQWFGKLNVDTPYCGLSATYKLEKENEEEMEAIRYLVDYVDKTGENQPVVLESDGESYSKECKVSALTGFPTILGWHTHEWLWHNKQSYMENRKAEVYAVYTSSDETSVRDILDKYNVSYIFVGLSEKSNFEYINYELLENIGDVIYQKDSNDGTKIEIVKVNR